MEILDTTKINYYLIEIISKAKEELTLISPYIKIDNRLINIILEKAKTDLLLTLVYGKEGKIDNDLFNKLKEFKNLSIYYCKDLHAKIYQNENSCVITSMNLYDYSQIYNYEVGIYLEKENSIEQFSEISTLTSRIIKGSEIDYTSIKTPKKTCNYDKVPTWTIAKNLNIQESDIIELFKNNGLIKQENTYWKITQKGKDNGGEVRYSKQFGYFNVWPSNIVEK